jgi:phospholipid transport system substrate-binding protein
MTLKNHSLQSNIKILLNLLFGSYLLFSASLLSAETGQEKAMQDPVNQLHDALLSIMKTADSSSYEERYALLESIIAENFNTPLISRVILSRYWKSLDEKAQADFITLFNRLTISTYVSRFDSYENETFKHLSIEPMKKDRFLVKTEFVQAENDSVSFNYIVQNDKGKWKIISVIANGINDLSLKRGEYSSVIKEQGFDALIENIKQKISDLQSDSSQ